MKNPYIKFQNPSLHGSEVMLRIKKHNGRMHVRTNVPEAICPSKFFEVGGIMSGNNTDTDQMTHFGVSALGLIVCSGLFLLILRVNTVHCQPELSYLKQTVIF